MANADEEEPWEERFEIRDGVICEKDLLGVIVWDLMRVGATECATDFLYGVFFEDLPKGVETGFGKDDDFLMWEREIWRSCEAFSTIDKVLVTFRDRVFAAAKAFLFANLSEDIEMQHHVYEVVHAKIMIERWLFVGYESERRKRALKIHKRQVLRKAIQACQDLPGFTGTLILVCFFVD